MTPTPTAVVVGGGVLGTMHARAALALGYKVTHLEREPAPRGASVRNFGLIWVSGRAPGTEVALALRARELWEAAAHDCPGTGFRPVGSLTVATDAEQLGALEMAAAIADAKDRSFDLLDGPQARAACPALGNSVVGALRCGADAIVEPRLVPAALREKMSADDRYQWLPGLSVTEATSGRVTDHLGRHHRGDIVVICPGAEHSALAGPMLANAPLRRVRLQMLETDPFPSRIGPALADIDTLRYYPAFAGAARSALGPQDPLGAKWASQLLLVQRENGSLTIGDTHSYDEPFDFDYDAEPEQGLLAAAQRLVGEVLPAVRRRWTGVYSQTTDGSTYLRREVEPGVIVVTGPGGRGMTMAPAIAEETFL